MSSLSLCVVARPRLISKSLRRRLSTTGLYDRSRELRQLSYSYAVAETAFRSAASGLHFWTVLSQQSKSRRELGLSFSSATPTRRSDAAGSQFLTDAGRFGPATRAFDRARKGGRDLSATGYVSWLPQRQQQSPILDPHDKVRRHIPAGRVAYGVSISHRLVEERHSRLTCPPSLWYESLQPSMPRAH